MEGPGSDHSRAAEIAATALKSGVSDYHWIPFFLASYSDNNRLLRLLLSSQYSFFSEKYNNAGGGNNYRGSYDSSIHQNN